MLSGKTAFKIDLPVLRSVRLQVWFQTDLVRIYHNTQAWDYSNPSHTFSKLFEFIYNAAVLPDGN